MERELNEIKTEDVTVAIKTELCFLSEQVWFRLYLRNLDFNGDENTYLTDEDVNDQAENWEEKAKEMLEQAQDDRTKQTLQRTIELVPKVFTGMYGHVAAEEWKDFCQSSREMAETIRSLFGKYGLEELIESTSIS